MNDFSSSSLPQPVPASPRRGGSLLIDEYDPWSDTSEGALESERKKELVAITAMVVDAFTFFKNNRGCQVLVKVTDSMARKRAVSIFETSPGHRCQGQHYGWMVATSTFVPLTKEQDRKVAAEIGKHLRGMGYLDIHLLPDAASPMALFYGPADQEQGL